VSAALLALIGIVGAIAMLRARMLHMHPTVKPTWAHGVGSTGEAQLVTT